MKSRNHNYAHPGTLSHKVAWRNVTPANPCPLCGKPDNCSISECGGRVKCRRPDLAASTINIEQLESDARSEYVFARLTDQGWQNTPPPGSGGGISGSIYTPVNRQKSNHPPSQNSGAAASEEKIQPAPPDTLDAVYRSLLTHPSLTLSDCHRKHLAGRGLSDEQIRGGGYRTLPSDKGRAAIARDIHAKHGGAIFAVPGFARRINNDGGDPYPTLRGAAGLITPVLDAAGKIIALQSRPDYDTPEKAARGAKYQLISSSVKSDAEREKYLPGPSPGTPVHFSRGWREIAERTGYLRIVEGVVKANVAQALSVDQGLSVAASVGLSSVGSWRGAIENLAECEKYELSRKSTTIVVSLDRDAESNRDIARCLAGIIEALHGAGWRTAIETWPVEWREEGGVAKDIKRIPHPKAVDDLLALGLDTETPQKPELITGPENVQREVARIQDAAARANPTPEEKIVAEARARIEAIDSRMAAASKKEVAIALENLETQKAAAILLQAEPLIYETRVRSLIQRSSIRASTYDKIIEKISGDVYCRELNRERAARAAKSCAQQATQQDHGGMRIIHGGKSNAGKNENPGNEREIDERPGTPITSIFPDAPVSAEILLPLGYSYSSDGWLYPQDGDESGAGAGISSALSGVQEISRIPIIIDRRYVDEITGDESVRVCWRQRPGHWKHAIMEKDHASCSRNLTPYARRGLPVHAKNTAEMAKYLTLFDQLNEQALPQARVKNQLTADINADGIVSGFMLGNTYISHKEEAAAVEFSPLDAGNQQVADRVQQCGDIETWITEISQYYPKAPHLYLMIYAAMASPLLRLVNCPNFIVDISKETTSGKSEAMAIVASVWGNPIEGGDPPSYFYTWDATSTGIERSAMALGNLPLMLDDTKKAGSGKIAAEKIAHIVYAFTSGQSKIRGSVKGLQAGSTWRQTMISNGEYPITSFTKDAGTHARCLALWAPHGPFGESGQDIIKRVDRTKAVIAENHGVIGRALIEWMVNNPEECRELKAIYRESVDSWVSKLDNNNVLNRYSKYFAVLCLAAAIAWDKFGFPRDENGQRVAVPPNPITPLLEDFRRAASRSDAPREAMEWLRSWAESNVAAFLQGGSDRDNIYSDAEEVAGVVSDENEVDGFYGSPGSDEDEQNSRMIRRAPHSGWAGIWNWQKYDWKAIHFYPDKLESIMSGAGYHFDSIVRSWSDRNWLISRQGITRNVVKLHNRTIKVITIRRKSFEI